MRLRLATGIVLAVALLLPACGAAQQRPHGHLALKKIGNFESPVDVAAAPGFPRLLFVVEQPGRVAVLNGGHHLAHPFLDIDRKSVV